MTLPGLIRQALRRFGYDIVRFDARTHEVARLQKLLADECIDLVLDVGSNIGQFARRLREIGYSGPIISFEPQSAAFAQLAAAAAADGAWQAAPCGLGAADYRTDINIAKNSQSSSLRPMLPQHAISAPHSTYVGSEEIQVRSLDSVLPELGPPGERIFLKLDTQGFEKEVLDGAKETLSRVQLVQLEMSLVPLYEGETLIGELLALLGDLGFVPVDLQHAFTDRSTGRLLQVDGIFRRSSNAID